MNTKAIEQQEALEARLTELLSTGDIDSASTYGEPGYTDPDKSILFANWNDLDLDQDKLETQGYAIEWSDEWYIDHNNDKAWRTLPDSWSWTPQLRWFDGYALTPDDDISDWIDACRVDYEWTNPGPIPNYITPGQLTEVEPNLVSAGVTIDLSASPQIAQTPKQAIEALHKEHGSSLDVILFRETNRTGHELELYYTLCE